MVRHAASRPGRQTGFTYLGLLFAMAVAGIALAGTGVLWQMEGRREKEKSLLFYGEAYRRAIGSYYDTSPGGEKQYPASLEDLLLDKRFPYPVRHLRRLYRDPMVADGEWNLIRQQGRVAGVASRSSDKPIKRAGFTSEQAGFDTATRYSEWQFIGSSNSHGPAPISTAPAGG